MIQSYVLSVAFGLVRYRAESSLAFHWLNALQNFSILRSCSVVRFIDSPPGGGKNQTNLVCYLTRTTRVLLTIQSHVFADSTR
jgi:hypothetical protein